MVRGPRKKVAAASAVAIMLVVGLLLLAPLATSDMHEGPGPEPWVESHEWAGVIDAAVAWQVEAPGLGCIIVAGTPLYTPKTCGGLRFGDTNGEVAYTVTATVETIVVELAWDPDTPASALQLDTLCPEVPRGPGGAVLNVTHPCYFAPQGDASGAHQIRVDREHWETHGYDPLGQWAARVFASANALGTQDQGIGAGAVYEESFTIYVTLFHGERAPEDFTAIP